MGLYSFTSFINLPPAPNIKLSSYPSSFTVKKNQLEIRVDAQSSPAVCNSSILTILLTITRGDLKCISNIITRFPIEQMIKVYFVYSLDAKTTSGLSIYHFVTTSYGQCTVRPNGESIQFFLNWDKAF